MAEEIYLINCVCTANICRSPMAERLLTHALEGEKEDWARRYKVVSSGIVAMEGQKASKNSVKALKTIGLDLTNHSSQRTSQEIVERSALTLCMTKGHEQLIKVNFPDCATLILLFRGLLPRSKGQEIIDPYGANLNEYEECRDMLVEAIPSIIGYLRKEKPKPI